jgi:multidrug transporter EmrE-like cation transporter
MWLRYMFIAFLCNGLCSFSVRLVGNSVVEFLLLLYATGFLFALAINRKWPKSNEVLFGFLMGCASFVATFGQMLALNRGMPGTIVFPVFMGGGLIIVILGSRVIFRERLTYAGMLGIAIGIVAQVLFATA